MYNKFNICISNVINHLYIKFNRFIDTLYYLLIYNYFCLRNSVAVGQFGMKYVDIVRYYFFLGSCSNP